MKNAMVYKDYAARVEFDADDRIFFGRLAGIRDIVTFHGRTVEELEAAFKEAIDHYLDTCAKLGDEPGNEIAELSCGAEETSFCVYFSLGLVRTSSTGPISTSRPARNTATR